MMPVYYIQFYSRKTGALSKKTGYRTLRDAEADLKKNHFADAGGMVWDRADYIARIREEKP